MNDFFEFPNARLLIFAKAPVPGRVKTRLAGRLGTRGAARVYQQLLARTLKTAQAARLCPVELWCAPDARHGFFSHCRRAYGVRLRRQGAGDLGRRMKHALDQALREGRQAVLIGGDCASVGAAELRAAFERLASGYDAVLGPARDGGYVLVGLSRPCPPMFRAIPWSAPTVMATTRRRLRQAGIAWFELPVGWDVDTPADLKRLRRSAVLSPSALAPSA
ncbi:MAG TPA: TIGR04282 family arsenosugar biosynthesis glycosyltransferase [Candidatus Competibacter sp.]|nr:TIGR04282 family arsenosugar biosynthesis glycosyltransferase [Candidatus Competibacter sp.]HUM93864.1 TIGR04282 family arsenosugar biosynthesis glycosyltransferase [Candidatus Competibacter sp.]